MSKSKILLIDIDSYQLPNLALMKLSSYFKEKGFQIVLKKYSNLLLSDSLEEKYEHVFASCIYSWNKRKVERLLEKFKNNITIGGSGCNGGLKLPNHIENKIPDYSLYDVDYSMGYTSRGCIRTCPWCKVPRIEGGIKQESMVADFLYPDHKKVILLDNNFLASSKWKENAIYMKEHEIKICFTQGLDIRLINEETADILANFDLYDNHFRSRKIFFAFDTLEMESAVKRGVQYLINAGIKKKWIFFYMLVGFGIRSYEYTWDFFLKNDWKRFEILRDELDVNPFVMVYNNRKDIPLLKFFKRFGQKPAIWKKVKHFEDYEKGKSHTIIDAYKNGLMPKGLMKFGFSL